MATAIATVLVGFATIIATLIAKRAPDAVPKVERAYVFVTVTRQSVTENDRTLVIKVHFHNRGRTPAMMRMLRTYVVWGDSAPQSLLEHDRANREMPQGLVIASGDEHVETIREHITELQFRDLADVANHAFVVGLLSYQDVWGDKHQVGFCWMSQPQRDSDGIQFIPYPLPLNYFT